MCLSTVAGATEGSRRLDIQIEMRYWVGWTIWCEDDPMEDEVDDIAGATG